MYIFELSEQIVASKRRHLNVDICGLRIEFVGAGSKLSTFRSYRFAD